jgi:hypothetical protein
MLENLLEYYRKSDGATKKKILGCIFAEKLVLENGRVATSTFTEPIQFIINASEVLGSSKKKQEVDFDLLCRLVPGAGLEPAQPQWSQDFKSCVSTIPPSGRNQIILNQQSPVCRTLSRFSGNSTIRASKIFRVEFSGANL